MFSGIFFYLLAFEVFCLRGTQNNTFALAVEAFEAGWWLDMTSYERKM